ncbi:hypothetical protein AVEN_61872-1, partial [Araneus ventricosus]
EKNSQSVSGRTSKRHKLEHQPNRLDGHKIRSLPFYQPFIKSDPFKMILLSDPFTDVPFK